MIVSIRESVDVWMYFCQGAHYEVRFYKEGEVFALDILSGECPNFFKEHSGHLDYCYLINSVYSTHSKPFSFCILNFYYLLLLFFVCFHDTLDSS